MFSGAALNRNRAAIVATAVLFLALQPWIATSAQGQPLGGNCSNDSLGLTPLIDMGDATYMGFEGGLYPGGSNAIRVGHQALGMSLLNFVGPLDADGRPNEAGKIGFMGVGVSTTGRDWDAFADLVSGESGINPQATVASGTTVSEAGTTTSAEGSTTTITGSPSTTTSRSENNGREDDSMTPWLPIVGGGIAVALIAFIAAAALRNR